EVSGDAAMRQQVRGRGIGWALLGFLALAAYGWLVNHVNWKFSAILGAYVAVFAWAGILWGKIVDHDRVSGLAWLGLVLISVGGILIQVAAFRAHRGTIIGQ